jgi:hypothetical protein
LFRKLFLRDVEDLGEFGDVFGGGLRLPVEERGYCDLRAAQGFGD